MGTLNIFFVRYHSAGGVFRPEMGPFMFLFFYFSLLDDYPLDSTKVSNFGHGVVGCFGIIAYESNPNYSLDTSC